jgi:hypothetical protein
MCGWESDWACGHHAVVVAPGVSTPGGDYHSLRLTVSPLPAELAGQLSSCTEKNEAAPRFPGQPVPRPGPHRHPALPPHHCGRPDRPTIPPHRPAATAQLATPRRLHRLVHRNPPPAAPNLTSTNHRPPPSPTEDTSAEKLGKPAVSARPRPDAMIHNVAGLDNISNCYSIPAP